MAIAAAAADWVKLFVKNEEMRKHFFFSVVFQAKICWFDCMFFNKENKSKRMQQK
jgi:hypothetical protein